MCLKTVRTHYSVHSNKIYVKTLISIVWLRMTCRMSIASVISCHKFQISWLCKMSRCNFCYHDRRRASWVLKTKTMTVSGWRSITTEVWKSHHETSQKYPSLVFQQRRLLHHMTVLTGGSWLIDVSSNCFKSGGKSSVRKSIN